MNRYYNLNYYSGDKNQTVNLLRGITFCEECGKRMVVNSKRGGRNKNIRYTYRCPNKNHIHSNREFNRDYLDKYVIMLLEKQLFNKDAMDCAVKEATEQKWQQMEQWVEEY